MTGRWREAVLPIVLAAVAALGVGIDAGAGEPDPLPGRTEPAGHVAAKAVFCPPSQREGTAVTDLYAGVTGAGEATVGIEPAAADRPSLAPGELLVHHVEGHDPVNVVGYGAPVTAGAAASFGSRGAGAARCAESAATSWFFAEGSSALGFDERILVYNPFLDEAVVRVSFLTPEGERSKAALSDIPVPAQSAKAIAVNEFIFQKRQLGVSVEAARGRVVAWRALTADPKEGIGGVQFDLGASSPSATWYFPEGGLAPGLEERIAILNPGEEEATVTISLATANDGVQPPRLVEIPIAAKTSASFSLSDSAPRGLGDVGGVSAVVTSTNAVEVVAERTVVYDGAGIQGIASEVGATTTHESWWLPPAAAQPTTDVVTVMNPGADDAVVSISLLRASGTPLAPARLEAIRLKAGARLKIPVGALSRGRPMAALVTADAPIVAERFSYSDAGGDVASVIGIPVERSEE